MGNGKRNAKVGVHLPLAIALLAVAALAAGSAGALDDTFGDGGVVVTQDAGHPPLGLALQSSGKMIVGGFGSDGDFHLRRYDTDGALDATFGTDGVVSLSSWTVDDFGVDAADRILVIGREETTQVKHGGKTSTTYSSKVLRLLADGDLDTSFDLMDPPFTDERLAIQPDGKILVAGAVSVSSGKGHNRTTSTAIALSRYQADGSPDTAFGSDGTIVDDVTSDNDRPTGIGLQSDGGIVVSFLSSAGGPGANELVRYTSAGSRDTSFGTNGIVAAFQNDVYSFDMGMAIDSQDRIVVVSTTDAGADFDGVVRRYAADGALDSSFGTNGEVTTGIDGDDVFVLVQIASGDRPVLGGALAPNGIDGATADTDTVTLRLNEDGSADSSYGTGGLSASSTPGDGRFDAPRFLRIDSNGEYLMAGESYDPSTTPLVVDWMLVRWNG